MSARFDILDFAVIIALALLVGILSTKPAGKRILGCALGCMIAIIGILGITSGRIVQRWGGGPPIEGSLATVGSVLTVGVGIYIIFLTLFQKSDDHGKKK